MLGVYHDTCSMCLTHDRIHERCASCRSESVQKKDVTENKSKSKSKRRGRGGVLTTFPADAALPLRAPAGPQQAVLTPLTEPLVGHTAHTSADLEPHMSPPLSLPELRHFPFFSYAEPHTHPHELPSRPLQPESSDSPDFGLLPLLSSGLLSGYDTLLCAPPVDTSDHLSPILTGSVAHPVATATAHWFPDPIQPRQAKLIQSVAAKQQVNHLFPATTPKRKRSDILGDEQDNEEEQSFACPFWKRDPLHSWSSSRSCCSNHKRIRDVKQHIYRNHSNRHVTDRTKRPNQDPSGGLTELQYLQLKGYSNRTTTKSEQWFAIWDIVFPDLPRPASPYVNHDLPGELDEYKKYRLTRDSDSLPALTPDIATPVQSPQGALNTTATPFGDSPWFDDSLPLLENMSVADMSYMGSLDCGLDLASWQLLCDQEITLHGDYGKSQASYLGNIPTSWEQANVPPYHLAVDGNIFYYPWT